MSSQSAASPGVGAASPGVEVTPAQRRLLEALKRRSEATAEELAERLGTSTSAVRQHLAPLRSAGLVTARPARGHTGRPPDVYRCTQLTEPLFAAEHDLAIQILDEISDEHPELIERIFERRRQRMSETVRNGLDSTTTVERVAAVASQFDTQGYLSDFEEHDDGTFRINLHNCPISNVADRYPQACAAELRFIEDLVPDASVMRTKRKTADCSTCAYQITPGTQAPAHSH